MALADDRHADRGHHDPGRRDRDDHGRQSRAGRRCGRHVTQSSSAARRAPTMFREGSRRHRSAQDAEAKRMRLAGGARRRRRQDRSRRSCQRGTRTIRWARQDRSRRRDQGRGSRDRDRRSRMRIRQPAALHDFPHDHDDGRGDRANGGFHRLRARLRPDRLRCRTRMWSIERAPSGWEWCRWARWCQRRGGSHDSRRGHGAGLDRCGHHGRCDHRDQRCGLPAGSPGQLRRLP